MLTIKLYREGGEVVIIPCDKLIAPPGTKSILFTQRGLPEDELLLSDGDSAYIENIGGKTVYIIRG